ncbi:MAG: hypothetical protein KDK97_13335 [Verrucomicrobiales bacterium]|nr:hypothetical protein [Verrucomicrobiales bacterium]MCP5556211.1 hypothetical protein [Verrucomicrobiaceae bacterium]
MSEEDPVNPYAAPQALIEVAPRSSPENAGRRPMSVRIATALVVLQVICAGFLNFRQFAIWGVRAFSTLGIVNVSYLVLGLFGLGAILVRPRSRAAFWLLLVIMGWLVFNTFRNCFFHWKTYGTGPPVYGALVVGLLLAVLFFRIGFGRPSRHYFSFGGSPVNVENLE